MPVKVMCIVGTRPEAIKMAPVVLELRNRPGEFDAILCSTGQHRELLRDTLSDFGLQPDIDLDVMTENQSLPILFSRLLAQVDKAVRAVQPDWVLVQGDTASVAAASLAAHFNRVKIGHVEAGLRSGDKWNPFPEEINRRIVSVCADLNFAPTSLAVEALQRENVDPKSIIQSGNTVVDALKLTIEGAGERSWKSLVDVSELDDEKYAVLLVTLHRRESHGEPMRRVLISIQRFVQQHGNVQVIFPVHPNPNVKGMVYELLGDVPRVWLVDPLPYRTFSQVMAKSHIILTDSGGVQEEAPSLGIPVLVARDTTERPEGVMAGTSVLVGTDEQTILTELEKALATVVINRRPKQYESPFGDGTAAVKIADAISTWPK